jgi:hypothetical protein
MDILDDRVWDPLCDMELQLVHPNQPSMAEARKARYSVMAQNLKIFNNHTDYTTE